MRPVCILLFASLCGKAIWVWVANPPTSDM